MLTIRLHRTGRKNQPFFKIVVTEKTNSSTRGRFTEELGFYNPLTKERKLNGERAKYWMSVGAQPSATVYNMLVTEKVVEGKKIAKHKSPRRRPASTAGAKEAPAEEAGKSAAETEQKSGFGQNAKQELEQEPKQKPDFDQNTLEPTPEPALEKPREEVPPTP